MAAFRRASLMTLGACLLAVGGPRAALRAGEPATPRLAATTRPATGWIWSPPDAQTGAPEATVYFRLDFDLDQRPAQAVVIVTADNAFQLFVNGQEAAGGSDWRSAARRDIAGVLRAGHNCLAVEASNPQESPAGLLIVGTIETGDGQLELSTSAAWRWSAEPRPGWARPETSVTDWTPAVVLGELDMPPWSFQDKLGNARALVPITEPVDWGAWRERVRRELAELPEPPDPPGHPDAHPVDRFLAAWWAREEIEPPAECDDATFARRAYLDIVGYPPNEDELKAFLEDDRHDRHARVVEHLLADDLDYTEGWMAWWCDLLRNDEQTNIDDLRKPVTRWLFAALKSNRPYDRMVAELLNPRSTGADGYLKGINWRGRVNASQQPALQAAQNVGQVFLGTNIKCASCHDHFTKPYLLDDAYGLASFFSPENLEIHRCDKPIGVVAPPSFNFADLGRIPTDADYATRLETISVMVTTPKNPRFARTMVNRLWQKLMGRGLIEPLDDYHARPANKELLDWLAYEFMDRDYDLKKLIRLLMTSRGYRLKYVTESGEQMRAAAEQAPVYRGPILRRLSSEQFLDAVSRMTGHWPEVPTMNVDVPNPNIRAWRHKRPGPLALALGRPTREQVTTCRVEDPSMLQMLEMVNGDVLAARLEEGAAHLLASPLGRQMDADSVLDTLHLRAYARPAAPTERDLLRELVGRPGDPAEERKPAWADLLWIIVMSPEFQYIQ